MEEEENEREKERNFRLLIERTSDVNTPETESKECALTNDTVLSVAGKRKVEVQYKTLFSKTLVQQVRPA